MFVVVFVAKYITIINSKYKITNKKYDWIGMKI